MDVKTVKLINGEEVIGNLIRVGGDTITFENTVTVQVVKHPETGEIQRGFADWPALAKFEQTVRIPLTAVSTMPLEIHEDLEREYVSAITGMQLPPATPKILLS